MADLLEISKALGIATLAAGSAIVWWRIADRRQNGQPILEMRPHQPSGWPDAAPFFAFAAGFVMPFLLVALVGQPSATTLAGIRYIPLWAIAQIAVAVGIIAAAAPLRAVDFGLDFSEWKRDVAVGGLGFLACLIPVYAVNLAVELLGWRSPTGQHPLLKLLEEQPEPTTIVWIAVSVIIAAPLAEELLFRVLLLRWLKSRLAARPAVFLSAVAFAAVHAGPGRPDFLPLFPLALILGYVYHQCHSYVAVVTVHALFNATNLALALA